MDIEKFQNILDKPKRTAYLLTLPKELFQLPKVVGQARHWKCIGKGCQYQTTSKQNLFKHIVVPCQHVQNQELPFKNWNDYEWPEDLGFQYPKLVPESLFQKMLRKQTQTINIKTEEDRINYWKSYVGQIVRLVRIRGYMRSSFKIIDEKWNIRFNNEWLAISKEGRSQYEDWKRQIILPFIRNNLDEWFPWHIQNDETSSNWNEWSIGVFGIVVRPHIPDQFY